METSVYKCLAFCQTLAMSGQKFTFSLCIGKDNFSFNNKELASSSCVKKKSPSQIRREQRRREERTVKNAAAKSTAKVAEVGGAEETVNSLDSQCSQCDLHFNAEEELKIHMEEDHTVSNLSTPEKERLPDQTSDLKLTPVHLERSAEVASLTSYAPDKTKTKCDDCNIQFPKWEELEFHNWCCHPGR